MVAQSKIKTTCVFLLIGATAMKVEQVKLKLESHPSISSNFSDNMSTDDCDEACFDLKLTKMDSYKTMYPIIYEKHSPMKDDKIKNDSELNTFMYKIEADVAKMEQSTSELFNMVGGDEKFAQNLNDNVLEPMFRYLDEQKKTEMQNARQNVKTIQDEFAKKDKAIQDLRDQVSAIYKQRDAYAKNTKSKNETMEAFTKRYEEELETLNKKIETEVAQKQKDVAPQIEKLQTMSKQELEDLQLMNASKQTYKFSREKYTLDQAKAVVKSQVMDNFRTMLKEALLDEKAHNFCDKKYLSTGAETTICSEPLTKFQGFYTGVAKCHFDFLNTVKSATYNDVSQIGKEEAALIKTYSEETKDARKVLKKCVKTARDVLFATY